MNQRVYTIPQLVTDLRRIRDSVTEEREILKQVRPLAIQAAASKAHWLTEKMYSAGEEQGFGAHILHEEEDHSLAVMAIAWLPSRGAPPHDHGTWAVIAGVDGPERNVFYERIDDRQREGHAELRRMGESVCGVGEAVAMPSGMIHCVYNDQDQVSVSLHIYGKHINYTRRSKFDVEGGTEAPFIVAMES